MILMSNEVRQLNLFDDEHKNSALEIKNTNSYSGRETASRLLNLGQDIKMLSLWQPWASFCVWRNSLDGFAEKQIETRGPGNEFSRAAGNSRNENSDS